jgi:tRNA A37 threonylcarbamoyladenosine dehydratase
VNAVMQPAPGGDADLERRFGGLKRLYGEDGYRRIRGARIAVAGLGGVGSWAAEALARCGVARLVLIDFDHIAESNINRQVHALASTLGQAKVEALRERIAQIHPGCEVQAVDAFVTPEDWPQMLGEPVDVVIDACDDPKAKQAMAAWFLGLPAEQRVPLVMVGAAGGKRRASGIEAADLVQVTHDPLLATLRQRLRKQGLIASAAGKPARSGLLCVYSREPVARPVVEACEQPQQAAADLNCHGYGSVVTVTAGFGLVAADAALDAVMKAPSR